MVQIAADRDQAKIEADKEITLKEMELKAQAQTSTNAVVDPPPRNIDAQRKRNGTGTKKENGCCTKNENSSCTKNENDSRASI